MSFSETVVPEEFFDELLASLDESAVVVEALARRCASRQHHGEAVAGSCRGEDVAFHVLGGRTIWLVTTEAIALDDLIRQHRGEILALLNQHAARSIAVIGSVARGEATSDSDIDFLVEFEPSSSLLDLIRLEAALSGLLGVDVDVISRGALLDRDEDIRSEAVAL